VNHPLTSSPDKASAVEYSRSSCSLQDTGLAGRKLLVAVGGKASTSLPGSNPVRLENQPSGPLVLCQFGTRHGDRFHECSPGLEIALAGSLLYI